MCPGWDWTAATRPAVSKPRAHQASLQSRDLALIITCPGLPFGSLFGAGIRPSAAGMRSGLALKCGRE